MKPGKKPRPAWRDLQGVGVWTAQPEGSEPLRKTNLDEKTTVKRWHVVCDSAGCFGRGRGRQLEQDMSCHRIVPRWLSLRDFHRAHQLSCVVNMRHRLLVIVASQSA